MVVWLDVEALIVVSSTMGRVCVTLETAEMAFMSKGEPRCAALVITRRPSSPSSWSLARRGARRPPRAVLVVRKSRNRLFKERRMGSSLARAEPYRVFENQAGGFIGRATRPTARSSVRKRGPGSPTDLLFFSEETTRREREW